MLPEWLKHAFAVEPPGPAEPDDEQRAVVERLCVEVVSRRLATPALAFLEMSRPLNYLGAQTLHFLGPIISAVMNGQEHRALAEFLECRGSIDYLCRRIEQLQREGRW